MPARLREPIELIRAGDYYLFGIECRATCTCGRARLLPPGTIVRRYGPEFRWAPGRLDRLAAQLKCAECGQRNPALELGQFE